MDQNEDFIPALLGDSHTIAVVGLSSHEDRPSYEVAHYMQSHGYRIVPVNPTYAGTHILGEHCYSSLHDAAAAVEKEGGRIDIVDCFRKSEHILPVVEDAIAIKAPCVWMQIGVINQAAADKAEAAGLKVVMDKCIKVEHGLHH
ncbi:CoA-binding protein [Noviherbaspirillum sp.]|uniref:CoA-binding protein n=1 Tax=Noviherbaspirillum sp. TaxID=1926288 RepID=UPI002B46660F|nr:CoA-binding protein [Noviherbaspirillum sp.]HJV83070.1 CoA-binding protein [Noviherbaspirillum sp.]